MSETNDILIVSNVTKTYPGVIALNNVSFSVKRGEVHALIGENGAGKSTIIKSIAGAIRPDKGSIVFDGQEMMGKSSREIRNLGVEVVYQEFNLASELSVYENIFMGAFIKKAKGMTVDKDCMIKRCLELFDTLGIKIDPEEKICNLTVAYKQFVEIGKAISKNAKILFMDEPTATLTNTEVKILFKTIRRLTEQGVTIIYVSHRMEEIFEITDRCTVFRDGHYITTVKTQDTSRKELIKYMVGREVTETYPERNSEIGEVVLKAENICGNYVSNINFTLHKGEILGFGGLVGSGRTETAELLFGCAKVEKGKIYLHGNEVQIDSPRKAIDLGIALVSEDRKRYGLVLDKSIMENITLPIFKRLTNFIVLNNKKQKEIADEQIRNMNIKTPDNMQLCKNLSGGNQQKVVLGKWMASDCDVFIFDEPTRGIDVHAKQEIYCLMNELAMAGKSIIMISSEMVELVGMSDRVIVFCEHKQTGELAKEDVSQEAILDMASGDK